MTTTALQEIEVASTCRKWPKYPKSKQTGMTWLNTVPDHWRIEKLKHVANVRFSGVDKKTEDGETPVQLCNYTDVYNRDVIHADIDFMEATATTAEIERFTLRRGDVLITKDSEEWNDIAVPACVVQDLPGVLCGYHLALIRPFPSDLEGAFLGRAFTGDGIRQQFHVTANGITRFGLPNRAIAGALFPIPPLDEQRAIAAFLDRETARIDELIAKKQRLIELLQEKRQALISRAVTRGVEGSFPLKDTRVPWFGAIPKHWKLHNLRRCVFRFIDYRGRTPTKTDSGVPLITAGAIKGGQIDHALAPEYIAETDLDDWMSRGNPEKGDLVITTEAPLGEVAQVTDTGIALAQRVILFKVNRERVSPEFLRYFYISECGRAELLSRASGSTATGIRADRLRTSLVIVPSLNEQETIVARLDSELERACNP